MRGSWNLILPALALSAIILTPVGFLIFGVFWSASPGLEGRFTLDNVEKGLNLGQNAGLLSNTFIFSIGSTVLAVSIGVALSFLLQRTNTPGRGVFDAIVLIQFVFPSFLGDIAWIFLLSPRIGLLNAWLMNAFGLQSPPFDIYTQGGMIWSQGIALAALAYLLIHPAFLNMDPAFEEAARISGASVGKSMRQITLPILYPSILTSSLFLFMISLASFETPTFIGLPGGIRVYMNAIHESTDLKVPAQYGVATAQAIVILAIMLAVLLFYLRTTRRLSKYVAITGKGYRPGTLRLGKWRYAAFMGVAGYATLAIFLPFALMVFVSFVPFYTATQDITKDLSLNNYAEVLSNDLMVSAAINTTFIAIAAAVVTTFAGAFLSYMALRSKVRGKRVFEAIGTLPLGFPGLVFGLALLWTFLSIPFLREYIYGTPWALVIAYLVIYLPLSMRSLSNTMIQIHSELEEAGQMAGATWVRTFRSITLPLMRPALINALILVLINSYRELGTAVILSGPGMFVLPVLILYFWRIGWIPQVAAATVLYGGSMMAVLLLARLLLRSKVR